MQLHHIHLRSHHPKKLADWLVSAFHFTIVSDEKGDFGHRLFRCSIRDSSTLLIISNARDGDELKPAILVPHLGIDHFCLETQSIDEVIERAVRLGARLVDTPTSSADGTKAAFMVIPGDIRVELVEFPEATVVVV